MMSETIEMKESVMLLKFKKTRIDAVIPTYGTSGAVGLDLSAAIDDEVVIKAGEWVAIGTGLCVELSHDMEMQIRSRSGLAFKHGVTVLNAPGTIDPDYRGEIKVLLVNHGKEDYVVKAGDRVAQAVVGFAPRMITMEVQSAFGETDRGDSGFGSTGV